MDDLKELDEQIRRLLITIEVSYQGSFAAALSEVLALIYKKTELLNEKIENKDNG